MSANRMESGRNHPGMSAGSTHCLIDQEEYNEMNNIHLKSLDISYFKGIRALHIDFDSGLTSIHGDNATGKTTV